MGSKTTVAIVTSSFIDWSIKMELSLYTQYGLEKMFFIVLTLPVEYSKKRDPYR